jgi:predicted small lipoprotein YifL
MKQVLSILLIAALLTGCGIKRPLELPGQGKHSNGQQKPVTADIKLPDDALSVTPPAPVPATPPSQK